MAKLIYFIRAAFQGMRSRPFVHGVAILILSIALFSGGLARYIFLFVDHFFETWASEAELTIYLRPELTPDEVNAFFERVSAQNLGDAHLVGPQEALERLRLELPNSADVLSNLPKNPLPVSIELRPQDRFLELDQIEPLIGAWERAPEVESVDYGREWLEKFESLAKMAQRLGALLLFFVLIAALVVSTTTLQLTISTRREEIDLLRLVGATNAFVKAPFLLEGMLQAAIATLLATSGLAAADRLLVPPIESTLAFLLGNSALPSIVTLDGFLEILAASMVVGILGSLIAVQRFLKA